VAESDRLLNTASRTIQETGHPDAVRWNERYRHESADWLSHSPKKLLLDFANLLPENGMALDVASGVGTNSIFLAEQGLTPFAIDISYVGLRLARERFLTTGIRSNLAVYDLKKLWLPENHFAVIINFCYLERRIFPILLQALKPGGLLFFECYLTGSHQMSHPEYYLESGELQKEFSELDIIHSGQVVREGGARGSGRKLDQLVARKRRRSRECHVD
jgi:SAM-dependent methyltransferase